MKEPKTRAFSSPEFEKFYKAKLGFVWVNGIEKIMSKYGCKFLSFY